MNCPPEVKVRLVPKAERAVLRNLMQLYKYDFTEFWPDHINRWGRYPYIYLPLYWREEGRYPFLIEYGGRPAGFALAYDIWLETNPTHWLAEFFVLRTERRKGIGRQAAFQVFRNLPGRWLLGEMNENKPAQAFWRQVIGEFTGGDYKEELKNGPDWFGPMQEFISEG